MRPKKIPLFRRPLYRWLQRKYRNHTMISGNTYYSNLALIDWWRAHHSLEGGAVVECGTWRGGMSFSIVDLCSEIAQIHCFDSFEGLPPTGALDGEEARRGYEDAAFTAGRNLASLEEFASGRNLLSSDKSAKVYVYRGWFENTLPEFKPDRPISILRLDGDWYESTLTCLENLYDHCARHALVIVDDYVTWEGCARAVHDFFSQRKLACRIREFRGVTYFLKQ